MWRAAAIGGPFFVRSFLGERFAKPTTSVTITARAAYPHAAAQTRIVSVARTEYLPRRRAAEERAAETGWGPRR